MTAPATRHGGAPSSALAVVERIARGYSQVFARSSLAPLLSRPRPVRRTGFTLDLEVRDRRVEADGVVSLTLAASDGRELPEWIPGAHLDVTLPSGVKRQYSLCGDPADRRRYRIAVREIPGGSGSVELHRELPVGKTIEVHGPRNGFRFAGESRCLFIAGGIGITPILPMARAAAHAGIEWTLVYAGRSRQTMPFLDEIDRIPGGTVRLVADDEGAPLSIPELFAGLGPETTVYLCGPAGMIDAAHAAASLDAGPALHTERFTPPPVIDGSPFEIRLARTGQTVEVAADESALDAILRAVPTAQYSCRQGFCGSCEVAVLCGEVDHHGSALLPEEQATAMLPCVSRSLGGPLDIDL